VRGLQAATIVANTSRSVPDPGGSRPASPSPRPTGGVKNFNGSEALLRVRDGKPNMEHHVPTESGSYAGEVRANVVIDKPKVLS